MRLIDADELEQKIEEMQGKLETDNNVMWAINKFIHKGLAQARQFLLDAPTVDAETPNGKWIEQIRIVGNFKVVDNICSCCGHKSLETYNYCPNCGAKMESDSE